MARILFVNGIIKCCSECCDECPLYSKCEEIESPIVLLEQNKKLKQALNKASQILQNNGIEEESKAIDCEFEL